MGPHALLSIFRGSTSYVGFTGISISDARVPCRTRTLAGLGPGGETAHRSYPLHILYWYLVRAQLPLHYYLLVPEPTGRRTNLCGKRILGLPPGGQVHMHRVPTNVRRHGRATHMGNASLHIFCRAGIHALYLDGAGSMRRCGSARGEPDMHGRAHGDGGDCTGVGGSRAVPRFV